jgi:hypothetical protein
MWTRRRPLDPIARAADCVTGRGESLLHASSSLTARIASLRPIVRTASKGAEATAGRASPDAQGADATTCHAKASNMEWQRPSVLRKP